MTYAPRCGWKGCQSSPESGWTFCQLHHELALARVTRRERLPRPWPNVIRGSVVGRKRWVVM